MADPEDRSVNEALWQEIVDNYGDRPDWVDPTPPPAPRLPESVDFDEDFEDDDDPLPGDFVQPDPEPAGLPEPRRLVAWLGAAVLPLLALLLALVGVRIPGWAALLGFGWFVAGVGYLVATMPRDEDTDEYDDGAQV